MTAAPRPQYFLFDLVMWVTFCGLLFGFVRWAVRVEQADDPWSGFYVISFGVWFVVWGLVRAMRTAPVCRECGRRFLPAKRDTKPSLCPRCRMLTLGSAELRQEQAKGWITLAVCTAILAGAIGLGFWISHDVRFGRSSWIVVPLCAFGLVAAYVVVAVAVGVIHELLLVFDRHALGVARKCARQVGSIERSGSVTIWWCGTTDPTAMLWEQMETSRQRFERLIGKPLDNLPRLCALVFERRRDFLAYHHNLTAYLRQTDGVYRPRPARQISLATEASRCRIHEPERTGRSLFLWYFLEAHKGFLPAAWLQFGITGALSNDPGSDSCWQLLRRMKFTLSRGTAMEATELFALSGRQILGLLRDRADHAAFARFTQFTGQTCSLVEYLAGAEAPDDRVGRFRSFLSDVPARGEPEAVFAHHFGHGFGPLLEEWRRWVQEQQFSSDRLPSAAIRAALLERLVPTIRDREQNPSDGVDAIRAMGGAGYALGADTLIDVLCAGDDRFTSEAAWALESISGLSLGNDADRWAAWWAGLDPKIVGAAQP